MLNDCCRNSGGNAREWSIWFVSSVFLNVLHILGVTPATFCSPERSFSALCRLKTYLRSTMGQQRVLTSLLEVYGSQSIDKQQSLVADIFYSLWFTSETKKIIEKTTRRPHTPNASDLTIKVLLYIQRITSITWKKKTSNMIVSLIFSTVKMAKTAISFNVFYELIWYFYM